jgi:capsular exopolysaccharide synthesis family protein
MSRLFEALQRFESEQPDAELTGSGGLTTDLLQPAKCEAVDLMKFQSVSVAVVPANRMVSLTEKESLGAEKFRFLGVRLRQLQQTRSIRKLLITSTIPEEGKSVVSANLAVTLARKEGVKVLLIDGDLRRPTLAPRFGLGKILGLSDWLQQDSRTADNIYYLEQPGFWLLPGGKPPENSLELMQAGRLSALMDQLSDRFDWVIIDSPPILPLADTSVWMRLADGILLVTREGVTEKRQLQRGLQFLDHSRLLGIVHNGSSDTSRSKYYYYRHDGRE